MTNKKPSLIEAAESAHKELAEHGHETGALLRASVSIAAYKLHKALAHAKKREALVEAVVKAARELNSVMSEGAWKDDPRIGYDEVQIDKWELREFKDALAALDRFDAGEGK